VFGPVRANQIVAVLTCDRLAAPGDQLPSKPLPCRGAIVRGCRRSDHGRRHAALRDKRLQHKPHELLPHRRKRCVQRVDQQRRVFVADIVLAERGGQNGIPAARGRHCHPAPANDVGVLGVLPRRHHDEIGHMRSTGKLCLPFGESRRLRTGQPFGQRESRGHAKSLALLLHDGKIRSAKEVEDVADELGADAGILLARKRPNQRRAEIAPREDRGHTSGSDANPGIGAAQCGPQRGRQTRIGAVRQQQDVAGGDERVTLPVACSRRGARGDECEQEGGDPRPHRHPCFRCHFRTPGSFLSRGASRSRQAPAAARGS
jgi:hypothetical protein